MRFLYFIISFFLCSAAHSQVAKDQTLFRHGIFAPAYGQVSVFQSSIFESTFAGLSGGWQVFRFDDYLSISLGIEGVGLGKAGTLGGEHWISLLGGVSQLVVMPGSSFGAIFSISSVSGYDEYDNSLTNIGKENEKKSNITIADSDADADSDTWRHRDISLTKSEIMLFYAFETGKMFTLGYGSESASGNDAKYEKDQSPTDIKEGGTWTGTTMSFGFRMSQF